MVKKLLFIFLLFVIVIGCTNKKSDRLADMAKRFNAVTVDYINKTPDLGIGVVNPEKFSFVLLMDTLKNYTVKIDNIENQKLIIPLINKPDYKIFYMVVKNRTNNYYQVYVNDKDLCYVSKDEFSFYSWENLLTKQVRCVNAQEGYTQKDINSNKIFIKDDISLIVKHIDGNWLYVQEEEGENQTLGRTYWVLWNKQGQLNISPIFLQ